MLSGRFLEYGCSALTGLEQQNSVLHFEEILFPFRARSILSSFPGGGAGANKTYNRPTLVKGHAERPWGMESYGLGLPL
jgi:hypothetical protein